MTTDLERNDDLPGMLAVAKGVSEQTFPHTMDARVWADEFVKLNSAADHGTMLGWFANAIMAGYDTARTELPSSPAPGSTGQTDNPPATLDTILDAWEIYDRKHKEGFRGDIYWVGLEQELSDALAQRKRAREVTASTPPAQVGVPALPEEPEWLTRWRKYAKDGELPLACAYIDSLHEHYRRALRTQFLDAVDKCASLQTELAEAMELLNPVSKDETLIGAIRNILQAKMTAVENSKEAMRQLEAAERKVQTMSMLLREWLDTELDSMDTEFMPWIDQFTQRVEEALKEK